MNEENTPQSIKMSYILHRPWSDILFETTLPPLILEKIIKISDEVLADSKRISWGGKLAGQIKEELLIEPKLLEKENLLNNKKSFKEEDLIIHCKQFLGDFKSPSKIHFLKEMPKGSSGKIQRFKV